MLPPKVINKLFFRLSNVYGSQWSSLWKDNDIEEVKDQWADELGFFAHQLEAFAWALDHLPERAPNLVQFKKLLYDMPTPHQDLAIDYTKAAPIPEAIAVEMRNIKATPVVDHKAWAKRILADVDNGIPRRYIAVRFAKEALGIKI
tara:strand:+ start:133 stop:570 length:438 start_codon:yes stop_codon:yes gene_type:complete